jgi:hypothetical protein
MPNRSAKTLGVVVAVVALVTGPVVGPAQASLISYFATLNGPSESPPNASPATGFAEVDVDSTLNTMEVIVTFSGLTSGDTAAHIHCCTALPDTGTAGVATVTPTFTGFPSGVTSGSYSNLFDMTLASSYNPAFITANGGTAASAKAVLFTGIAAGDAYLNIHTTNFPGGEIRGFLRPAQVVPEPGTLALFGIAAAGLAWRRRKR